MSIEIRAIQQDDLSKLSQFLITGFNATPDAEFAKLDVLAWKYLDFPGDVDYSRCFVAVDNDQIMACIGLSKTRLVVNRSPRVITASHGFDWLSANRDIATGLMVGQRADQCADIQLGIGGTVKAVKIRERTGFTIAPSVPEYCRILRPLHYLRSPRQVVAWRCLAKIAREYWRWLRHPRQKPNVSIVLQRVESFGAEVTQIVNACQMPEIHTLRTPELLNHFLRYPRKKFTGWHFLQDGRIRGFALLSITQQGNARVGKIADCFLDCSDVDLWHAAIHALAHQLREQSADMVVCYGTTSWMANALTRNGFYCQRLSPFAVRDPKKLLPEAATFYLTHLEGDHAYL
jgi:hypothetical protein